MYLGGLKNIEKTKVKRLDGNRSAHDITLLTPTENNRESMG